jgi:hypothetical protein
MKILRVLYGTWDGVWNDIPTNPIFENEIVFVWGLVNNQKIQSYGYNTLLIDEMPTEERYSSRYNHFAHKLRAIDLADKMYDEYLFLDWDVYPIKKIDNKFFELIRNRGNLQIPIYSYNPEFKDEMISFSKTKEDDIHWQGFLEYVTHVLDTQIEELRKYSWILPEKKLTESGIFYQSLPNFSFYYTNGIKLGSKLIEISEKYNIKVCIEEYSLYKLMQGINILDFIRKYEPIVVNGATEHNIFKEMNKCIQSTNEWVAKFVEKDIYLVHNVEKDRLHLYSSLPRIKCINEN